MPGWHRAGSAMEACSLRQLPPACSSSSLPPLPSCSFLFSPPPLRRRSSTAAGHSWARPPPSWASQGW